MEGKEIRLGEKSRQERKHLIISAYLFIYSSLSITIYLGISTSVNILFTFALSARGLWAVLALMLLWEGLIITTSVFIQTQAQTFVPPSLPADHFLSVPPKRPPAAVAVPTKAGGVLPAQTQVSALPALHTCQNPCSVNSVPGHSQTGIAQFH